MDARDFLNIALDGNMNFGTLEPLAIEEIMEQYARHKMKESPTVDTSGLFAGYNSLRNDYVRLRMAAERIRHWHDTHDDGMIVSGESVRALWKALSETTEL